MLRLNCMSPRHAVQPKHCSCITSTRYEFFTACVYNEPSRVSRPTRRSPWRQGQQPQRVALYSLAVKGQGDRLKGQGECPNARAVRPTSLRGRVMAKVALKCRNYQENSIRTGTVTVLPSCRQRICQCRKPVPKNASTQVNS